MPFVAEFTTDGRSKMLDAGHAPDEDKDAVQKFESRRLRWPRPGDARCTCRCYTMVASCIPRAMVTLIPAKSRRAPKARRGTTIAARR
jgi:hypothetical protein